MSGEDRGAQGLYWAETRTDTSPPPEPPPPVVEGFEVLGKLGSGGMGVVYQARQRDPQRLVALKVLARTNDSEQATRRFVAEAEIASALDHPDIIRIYAFGESQHASWIAMEYLDGFELTEAMKDTALGLEDRLRTLARVALALDHAHARGVVHRDVKPSNIFLTREGGVRLLDFGIAKLRDVQLTATGQVIGTPAYMAPEQVFGQPVTPATDIFALGLVAYTLLTGSEAWQSESMHGLMMARCVLPPNPFRDAFAGRSWLTADERVIDTLHRVVHQALNAEPERRYSSARAFAEALEGALEGREVVDARGPDPSSSSVMTSADWTNRRIEWARARAVRLGAGADVGLGRIPASSTAQRPLAKERDHAMLVWVVLSVVFGLGLGVVLLLAFW